MHIHVNVHANGLREGEPSNAAAWKVPALYVHFGPHAAMGTELGDFRQDDIIGDVTRRNR